MSVNIKRNGTLQKIAAQTILFNANCAEVRTGTFNVPAIAKTAGEYANAIVTVEFSTPFEDTDYIVDVQGLTGGANALVYNITAKTKTSFTISVTNADDVSHSAGTAQYYAFKLVELEGYNSIYNKMTNIDSTPIDNSTNLVTSGGVYDAIKNASSVFIGTALEWESESAKTDYQVAILTDQPTVNAVDSTDGSTTVVANKNLVFKGTLEEWEALTTAEKKTYDEALITNDMDTGEVVDAVTNGDMRAVTSNAVYDAIADVSKVKTVSIEKTTLAGLTTGWADSVDNAHRAYRNGKQVVMNVALYITGTFTGTTGWQKMFELPTSLLEPGESFAVPYMVSVNDEVDSTLLNGNLIYFENGQTVNFSIKTQVILFVV